MTFQHVKLDLCLLDCYGDGATGCDYGSQYLRAVYAHMNGAGWLASMGTGHGKLRWIRNGTQMLVVEQCICFASDQSTRIITRV